MGAICTKSLDATKRPPAANRYSNGHVDSNTGSSNIHKKEQNKGLQEFEANKPSNVLDKQVEVKESVEKRSQEELFSLDDFYDGIPRYPSLKSRSLNSRQSAVSRVSEVSSRLSRAGSAGLGKAVEVLDTLGSSMTNLNTNTGFAYTVATKGNELGILAFEVANTIVKGSSLMHSLSKWNIRHLKEVVFPSEGVQNLISKDMDELSNIVESDKREELKIFSGEVVRFGNRCKDPQWHNLDRYFEKVSRDLTQRQLKQEEAVSVMEHLMTLVQHTAATINGQLNTLQSATKIDRRINLQWHTYCKNYQAYLYPFHCGQELYHELQVLDRFEQEYQRKRQEEGNAVAGQKGVSLATLRTEIKSQKKQVRNLKKKSLWSRSLEEVMEKLVDIVNFLLLEIHNNFGRVDGNEQIKFANNNQRLGPAGLSLHYANIVMQIDTLVARSSSMPANTRDSLYQNLPPSIKSALRSKLHSFHVKEELTITEIKDEMEKTLQWLVPMSTSTAKAHHGFGWVGEWANTGSGANRKPTAAAADIIRIETLHHADKDTTEAYILEQLLWLHHLANKCKAGVNGVNNKLPIKSPISKPPEKSNQQPKHELPSEQPLSVDGQ